jgi:hypothetical protein
MQYDGAACRRHVNRVADFGNMQPKAAQQITIRALQHTIAERNMYSAWKLFRINPVHFMGAGTGGKGHPVKRVRNERRDPSQIASPTPSALTTSTIATNGETLFRSIRGRPRETEFGKTSKQRFPGNPVSRTTGQYGC